PELTPTLAEFLQHVVDLSERAALLTRQLLAFARKPALSRQVTAMPELVRRTADLVSRTLQREVRLEVADRGIDDRPLVVRADGNQVQQALVNLALNSRDALEEREAAGSPTDSGVRGPVTFRVRHVVPESELPAFPQHVPPGDYVVLEVEDKGAG